MFLLINNSIFQLNEFGFTSTRILTEHLVCGTANRKLRIVRLTCHGYLPKTSLWVGLFHEIIYNE